MFPISISQAMTGNSDDKLSLDSRPFGSMKDLKAINLDYSSLKMPYYTIFCCSYLFKFHIYRFYNGTSRKFSLMAGFPSSVPLIMLWLAAQWILCLALMLLISNQALTYFSDITPSSVPVSTTYIDDISSSFPVNISLNGGGYWQFLFSISSYCVYV